MLRLEPGSPEGDHMHAQRQTSSAAYVINGGNPITGTLDPGGNKNAALPLIAATATG